jgi:hypothetical protein
MTYRKENQMSEELSTEVVDQGTGEVIQTVDQSLVFGTKDPQGIIERATMVANKLVDIVEKAKLYAMIKDKKYVKAEGWTTMAAMLGVFPRVVSCERVDREGEFGYTAKVDLFTISGALVGSGEAICTSVERFGAGKDEYAIKSMAQTRALGKACRISFSWIMALAGYEACPAEEMVMEQATVQMPKEKPLDFPEPSPAVKAAREKIAAEAPKPMTQGELEAAVKPPESKFFAKLHQVTREKGIDPEKMKAAIKLLYQKDSSKDLTESETLALIRTIEKGGIR